MPAKNNKLCKFVLSQQLRWFSKEPDRRYLHAVLATTNTTHPMTIPAMAPPLSPIVQDLLLDKV